jgi:hypothetical protein
MTEVKERRTTMNGSYEDVMRGTLDIQCSGSPFHTLLNIMNHISDNTFFIYLSNPFYSMGSYGYISKFWLTTVKGNLFIDANSAEVAFVTKFTCFTACDICDIPSYQ